MKYKFLLILFATVLFTGCREEDPILENPNTPKDLSSWDAIFETYWNAMNNSYSFWEIDPTDWDKVYNDYKPQFKNLKIGNSQDSVKAVQMFEKLTENLIDHHYGLILNKMVDGKRVPWAYINPGYLEAKKRGYYHKNFTPIDFIKTVNANTAKGRISKGKNAIIEDEDGLFIIISYLIDQKIAYLYLNQFDITGNISDPKVNETITHFSNLVENTPNLKGVIIDTRGNGGGALNDLTFILSPLISREYLVGYNRSKNGMGRLDFAPWTPLPLYPHTASSTLRKIETVPVVALADVNSVSMGELTPMAIRTLPHGYVVGERTFGGHGPLDGVFSQTYAGKLENDAFQMYTSTSVTKYVDGKCYEGIGITPDKEALFNQKEFSKGNDTQLDVAIQFINEKAK